MAKDRPGIMLYFETLQAIEELNAEDVKQVMSAILHYSRDGEIPAFHGPLAALWSFIRSSIDRDGDRYSTKQLRGRWLTYCRERKKDGEAPLDFDEWAERYVNDTLSYSERTVNDTYPTTSPSPTPTPSPTKESIGGVGDVPSALTPTPALKSRSRFVPPTLEEVTAYVRERGSAVDPQVFIDFYVAKGWMVGKTPMKDWKAACRNAEHWERWQERRGAHGEASGAQAHSGPAAKQWNLSVTEL